MDNLSAEMGDRRVSGTSPLTYGHRAARGAIWFALGLLIIKASSFMGQLALGWLLSKDDFGLYALAVSAASVASVLRDGGTRKILIHRGTEYLSLARPAFQMSLLFNIAAAAGLAAAAPALATFYAAPELPPLLWLTAVSIPLSSFSAVQRTKLAIDLRFKAISALDSTMAAIRQGSAVLFALSGFGPLSFVLPLIPTAVLEIIATRWLVGRVPHTGTLTWGLFKSLISQSQWLILSTLGLVLVLQGDYLTAGYFETQSELGVYFFAFQLTTAVSAPFSSAIASILTPSLTRLESEPRRQEQAYVKAIRVLNIAVIPLAVVTVTLAGPALHFCWAGRWDAAILVVQLLAASLPLRLLTPLALSLIESRGRWKWSALMLVLDACGTIAAAAVGSLTGGASSIAGWISAERAIVSLVECYCAGRLLSVSLPRLMTAIAAPVTCAVLVVGLTLGGAAVLSPRGDHLEQFLLRAVLLAGGGSVAAVVLRVRVREVLSFMRQREPSRPSPPDAPVAAAP